MNVPFIIILSLTVISTSCSSQPKPIDQRTPAAEQSALPDGGDIGSRPDVCGPQTDHFRDDAETEFAPMFRCKVLESGNFDKASTTVTSADLCFVKTKNYIGEGYRLQGYTHIQWDSVGDTATRSNEFLYVSTYINPGNPKANRPKENDKKLEIDNSWEPSFMNKTRKKMVYDKRAKTLTYEEDFKKAGVLKRWKPVVRMKLQCADF